MNNRFLTAAKNMVKKYTIASMWKPLLAATLAVGRNTRLLTVGSSILAMNAPMVKKSWS